MDKFRIESHKLLYHVPRVNDWLNNKTIYPIYMEISPSGSCNHRCLFCGLDFMGYQSRYLDADVLEERLFEMGCLGLKSIMYAGEGEPLLHKGVAGIISQTKKSGIDSAMTTNGVLLREALIEEILGGMEWIKVSINAGTAKTYSRIHSTKASDFDTVLKNMSTAVKIKKDNGYKCSLGMQMVLLPENKDEAVTLAIIARNIGMDYLVIKPYSQHPLSISNRYRDIKYSDFICLGDELRKLNTGGFNIIFRTHTMGKWDNRARNYKRCLALPFWSYMDSGGNIWGCSVYLGDERFFYGNIYESTFKEIWEGKRRMESLRWVQEELNPGSCRINCRMDEANMYLWNIKDPPEHVNFI